MKVFTFLTLFLTAAFITGCSQRDSFVTVSVSGTVTLDGQPIGGVSVMFSPQSGENRAAIGATKADGTFEMITSGAKTNGVMPGEYGITFAKYVMLTPDGKEPPPAAVNPDGSPPPEIELIRKLIVPEHYGDTAKPAFTVVVENGKKNEFMFELKTSR